MLAKSIFAIATAFVVVTSFASVSNAQRLTRPEQSVQPFTEAERNWFSIPEGRDDGMPHR